MTRSTGPAIVQRVQSLRRKRASAAHARRQVTRSSRTDGSNGKCRRRQLQTKPSITLLHLNHVTGLHTLFFY